MHLRYIIYFVTKLTGTSIMARPRPPGPRQDVNQSRIWRHEMRYLRNVAAALGLFGTMSTAAVAGPTYNYILNQTQAPGLSGTFGTVTLTQNGANSVNVLVDLRPTGTGANFGFVNSGGQHTPFAFNLSQTLRSGLSASFTQPLGGNFSANNTNFTFGLNTSGGNATPYGFFSVAIDITPVNNGTSNAYFGDLGFTLTPGSFDSNYLEFRHNREHARQHLQKLSLH